MKTIDQLKRNIFIQRELENRGIGGKHYSNN